MSEWYALDGVWHASVATRSSALHIGVSSGTSYMGRQMLHALCSENKVLYESNEYSDAEAKASGRACKRCLKLADKPK